MFAQPLLVPLAVPLALPLMGALGGMDSDAVAYIAAVETAKGSGMTTAQKLALDTFVRAEKTAGRWTSHKRLFLPIWANAAANAICLKSGTTLTWINSPTMGVGYVQGNGSTQYANFGTSFSALGLTTSATGFGWLSSGSGSGTAMTHIGAIGADPGTTWIAGRWIDSLGIDFFCSGSGGTGLLRQGASAIDNNYGIISCRRQGGVREISRRVASGRTILATATNADTGIVPTQPVFAMCFNNNGTPSSYSNIRFGAWFINMDLDSTNDAAFTLALKTLWETLTGLTLP